MDEKDLKTFLGNSPFSGQESELSETRKWIPAEDLGYEGDNHLYRDLEVKKFKSGQVQFQDKTGLVEIVKILIDLDNSPEIVVYLEYIATR